MFLETSIYRWVVWRRVDSTQFPEGSFKPGVPYASGMGDYPLDINWKKDLIF